MCEDCAWTCHYDNDCDGDVGCGLAVCKKCWTTTPCGQDDVGGCEERCGEFDSLDIVTNVMFTVDVIDNEFSSVRIVDKVATIISKKETAEKNECHGKQVVEFHNFSGIHKPIALYHSNAF
mmetsp:Transcript_13749/g.33146  ORF Transcript_13749/g.33146 Transcript_13749/m.33146 type:complete len:121 (+) Transcript_13749:866-1228(+)